MNKIDKTLSIYFFVAIPLILILPIWGSLSPLTAEELSLSKGLARQVWDILGINFMLWILTTLYFLVKMFFRQKFRDLIFNKLSRTHQRDEREEQITNNAAKFAMISTTAFMAFMLFISLFKITIAKYDKKLVPEKNGYIKIELDYEFFHRAPEVDKNDEFTIINYSGLPLNNSGILFLGICWMLVSFKYKSYKEYKS